MLSNFHTHTTYCDGKNTAEEMTRGALEKGFAILGFSGHSHTSYGDYEMTHEGTELYISDVRILRERYAGQIEIFCGIEQDFMSDTPTDGFDYVIGSVHSITAAGHECVVDWTAEKTLEYVSLYFGGNFYAFAEAYFAREAQVAARTNADIIGHFDLITKFNEDGAMFDESHPKYKAAAIDSMCEVLKTCNLFEVNTGAMYNYGRTNPYPAPWLLKELLARGGEVILSSDSHDIPSLGYRFGEMEELLRTVGFRHRRVLTRGGFVSVDL